MRAIVYVEVQTTVSTHRTQPEDTLTIRSLSAALLVSALIGCNGEEEQPAAAAAPVTRDAQLAFTIDAAADAARSLAEQAAARALHQETRAYAATLAADHRAIADIVTRTAQQGGVQPAESGVAAELIEEARTAGASMGNLTGLEYDLAFVEGQVKLQQALLTAIERDLGGLGDAGLRQLATDARPTIEAHARRGRQILTVLREAHAEQQTQTAAAARAAADQASAQASDQGVSADSAGGNPAQAQPAQQTPASPRPLGVPVGTPPDTNAVRSGPR